MRNLFLYTLLLPIFLLLSQTNLFSQAPKDSLDLSFPKIERYGATRQQISLRIGMGYQKAFHSELGLAYHKCNYGELGWFSSAVYLSSERIHLKDTPIYAVKMGYEVNPMILNLGIEVKYQSDFETIDWVFSPKIGL